MDDYIYRSGFRFPSRITAVVAALSTMLLAVTFAPRGVLYLFHIKSIPDWAYLTFWPCCISAAIFAVFSRIRGIRNCLAVVFLVFVVFNIGGCASEIAHEFN